MIRVLHLLVMSLTFLACVFVMACGVTTPAQPETEVVSHATILTSADSAHRWRQCMDDYQCTVRGLAIPTGEWSREHLRDRMYGAWQRPNELERLRTIDGGLMVLTQTDDYWFVWQYEMLDSLGR